MKKLLPLIFLLPTLSFAESYLCIAEASGGVSYNEAKDKWNGVSFSPDNKYVLKKENNKWVMNEFGKDFDLLYGQGCDDSELSDVNSTWDRVFCSIIGGQVQVDVKNLRYIRTYTVGYQDKVLKEMNFSIDTPFVEVGDCSKI